VFRIALLLAFMAVVGIGFADALQDPTKPSNFRKVESAASTFQLESILISGYRRVAVINGVAVAEGETISGAKVVAIEKGSVRIFSNGSVLKLILNSVSIRQEK